MGRADPDQGDKCADFEQFVQEILLPAITRIAPNVHRHVRALYPTHQEADGSYTYAFLMDPWLADASYDFATLFRQAYTEGETQTYLRIWEEVQAAAAKSL
ncbi:MAG: hypothetical protein R2867_37165 [Caldilineaceae bacterium]